MALFSHFSAGSDIRTKKFNFLIFGKSRFPQKKFYSIDYWGAVIAQWILYVASLLRLLWYWVRIPNKPSMTFS